MFTLGTYKTRAQAEAALLRWLDVYTEDQLDIEWTGWSFLLRCKS